MIDKPKNKAAFNSAAAHPFGDGFQFSGGGIEGFFVSMKLIPNRFTRDGWSHTLVKRQGDFAIYKRGGHYEVIRITYREAGEIMGRHVEASEVYPSAEKWGTHGWTLLTLEEAEAKMVWAIGQYMNRKEKSKNMTESPGFERVCEFCSGEGIHNSMECPSCLGDGVIAMSVS